MKKKAIIFTLLMGISFVFPSFAQRNQYCQQELNRRIQAAVDLYLAGIYDDYWYTMSLENAVNDYLNCL